jgi:NADH:ubiquinone oxidoreductase subunit C
MDAAQARTHLAALPGAAVSGEGAAIVVTVPAGQWRAAAVLAKETIGCTYFSFLSAVDWKEEGLEVVAWVDNLDARFSVLLKTRLGAGGTSCASVAGVYRGAGWMERECYDMFGIRRILLGDDWVGHPLLKSYAVDTPHPPYR